MSLRTTGDPSLRHVRLGTATCNRRYCTSPAHLHTACPFLIRHVTSTPCNHRNLVHCTSPQPTFVNLHSKNCSTLHCHVRFSCSPIALILPRTPEATINLLPYCCSCTVQLATSCPSNTQRPGSPLSQSCIRHATGTRLICNLQLLVTLFRHLQHLLCNTAGSLPLE